ncbi:MAG: hypothetical protein EBR82_19200, partial [Caulobacteraceae bacterium]|nr:hypothetical protein [Caulobacteraceae bacterium]
TGSNVVGLVFRYVNASNFYLLTLSNTAANCILYKRVGGTWTNLGQTSIGVAAGAVWRVRAVGSNIVVYANDVVVKITSDTGVSAAGLCGLSAGTIGQNATDDVGNTWQLDNFSVINYASSGGLVTNGINVTGDIQASGQIVAHGKNSAIYPAFTFAGDTNTGLYVPTADNLSIVTGGGVRATFASWGLYVTGVISPSSGSATAPSYNFGADTNTGIYNPAPDQLGVTVGGGLQWTFDSFGRFFTPDALTPPGAYDILTSDQISNSGGDVGGFVVFNSNDYIYTQFKAPNLSDGAGIFGEGKLFFTSGENTAALATPGIDFNILATDYGTQIGDFNVGIGEVTGSQGGGVSLYAGNSMDQVGGNVNIAAGNSYDINGGAVSIWGGSGISFGGAVLLEGGGGITASGGWVYILGGSSETPSSGGQVIISGGFDGIDTYGLVQIQTSPSGPIAVFGAGGSVQADTTISPATVSFGTGTTVTDDTTYAGYTIGQVVQALRDYGWLA